MAQPDNIRNNHVWLGIAFMEEPKACPLMVKKAIHHVISNITVVRIAVARSELMSFTPTLAKIAVREAKNADNNA